MLTHVAGTKNLVNNQLEFKEDKYPFICHPLMEAANLSYRMIILNLVALHYQIKLKIQHHCRPQEKTATLILR